ncbi:MAG: hypothetical protein RL637_809 [Pseudomonadota bacterium]|jgi:shikimate dehydrogenase
MDQYAVIGSPIKHSLSPRIHQLFAQQMQQSLNYTAECVSPEQFTPFVNQFFANGGLGLNCTVPLKELAFEYADQLTERAKIAKAVNTLCQLSNGIILGDNTDGIGLMTDLTVNYQLTIQHKRLLILGAGGATRGIIAPLLNLLPQNLVIANRTVEKALKLAKEFNDSNIQMIACHFSELKDYQFDLILNATSASLTNQLPELPETILASGGYCYDLAYSRNPTPFVKWGQNHGAIKSVDGLGMLVEQAAEAFTLWRGIRPQTQPIIQLLMEEMKS